MPKIARSQWAAIVVRGSRSRRLLSWGCLFVTVAAVVAGALGPMYVRSASNSLLLTRIENSPHRLTGLSWQYVPDDPTADPATAERSALRAADEDVTVGGYAKPEVSLRSDSVDRGVPLRTKPTPDTAASCEHLDSRGRCMRTGNLRWVMESRAGQCEHLVIEGRCPTRTGEAIVARIDVKRGGFRVGEDLPLGPKAPKLKVVGTYRMSDPRGAYWFDATKYASTPPQNRRTNPLPYSPAPFFVVPEQVRTAPNAYSVVVTRSLRIDSGTEQRLDRLIPFTRTLAKKDGRAVDGGALLVSHDTQLSPAVRAIDAERSTASATVTPATLSMIAVCLILLFRLVGSAADQRRSEIALAKLRGWRGGRLWALGMGEPLLLLAAGLVLGLIAVVPVSYGLARWWLRSDTPYGLTFRAVLVAVGVFVFAVGAAALAVRRVLVEPVHEQLEATARPRSTRRLVRALQVLVVAVAVAACASMLLAGGRRSPTVLDQLTPALVGLAAALLGAAGAYALARRWVRWTGGRRALAPFVGARALARRREGVLMVLPISVALALCVFAAGTWLTSQTWRDSVAAYQVGAPLAYDTKLNAIQALHLTERLDPHGDWVMAAAVQRDDYPNSVFLDMRRTARVSAWHPSWLPDDDLGDVTRKLSPAYAAPALTGRTLSLTATSRMTGPDRPFVTLTGTAPDGRERSVSVGPFGPGRSTRKATFAGCAKGCVITDLVIGGVAGVPMNASGSLVLNDARAGGTSIRDDLVRGSRAWRASDPVEDNVQLLPVAVGTGRADGLHLRVGAGDGPGYARLTSNAGHAVPAVLAGRETPRVSERTSAVVVDGLDGTKQRARVIGKAEALPYVGDSGFLGDIRSFAYGGFSAGSSTQVRILARTGLPPRIADGLRDADVSQPKTLADAQYVVDHDAYALSIRMYLLVAVAVLVLALAGAIASVAVQVKARRLDAASLRVVGVRTRSLVRASVLEFVTVFGIAAVAGIAAGVVAEYAVLHTLKLGSAGRFAPRVPGQLDLPTLFALVGFVVVVLVVLSSIAARQVVRHARGSSLRESG